MNPRSINPLTFKVSHQGTPITGSVSYNDTTAFFIPTNNLLPNSVYMCTVTSDAVSAENMALLADYTWSFRTGTNLLNIVVTDTIHIVVNDTMHVHVSDTAHSLVNDTIHHVIIDTTHHNLVDTIRVIVTDTIRVVVIDTSHITVSDTTHTIVRDTTHSIVHDTTHVSVADTTHTVLIDTSHVVLIDTTHNLFVDSIHVSIVDTVHITIIDTIHVPSPPLAPLLISPSNGSVCITKTPTLVWNLSGGALTYHLQVSTDSLFSSLEFDDSTLIGLIHTMSPLINGQKYYWRVSATNLGGTSAYSTVWNFKVEPFVHLGAAGKFGAFGGNAGVTNQGILTVVDGNIGTTAASTLITGFHDITLPPTNTFTETPLNIGSVLDTIYTATAPPGSVPGERATLALADAQTAFNFLNGLPSGSDPGAGELGGLVLAPGTYTSAGGSFKITSLDLTLDAQGDPNAIFIFQAATSLTVGAAGPAGARTVHLVGGAQAKNVFWAIGSAATINGAGGGTMVGTIIASAGVTFSTSGNVALTVLNGRALGLNASVTMVNTVITVPAP